MGRGRTCQGLYKIIAEKLMKGLGIPSQRDFWGCRGRGRTRVQEEGFLTHPVLDSVGEVAWKAWVTGFWAGAEGAQQRPSSAPRVLGYG